MTGVIWRINPFASHAISFGLLGDGFGNSPFRIKELQIDDDSDHLMPYLIAAGPGSIKGANLLTGEVRDLVKASDGARVLSNIVNGYVTVEADERTIYFLQERQNQLSIIVYSIADQSSKEVMVDASEVAGPLMVGSRIVLFSRSRLHVLEGDHFESFDLPDFSAWVAPNEVADLVPQFGRMASIVHDDSIYLPGMRGDRQGFMLASFRSQSPQFSFLPSEQDASYSQDTTGRLLIVHDGEIGRYDRERYAVLRRDEQLDARGIAYYDSSVSVAATKSAAGVQSLRFYFNGSIQDYSLSSLNSFVEIAGYAAFPGAFALIYLDDNSHLGIVVWDI